ncbi:MAG: hypothetical protein WCO56_18405 [Verrucomicrobiota bacterium]
MVANLELLEEIALPGCLGELLPRWLNQVPLYRQAARAVPPDRLTTSAFQRLPFITKQDIRRNFPRNFLRHGVELDALLELDLVEIEHTSGTSEERTPLLLERGWWDTQEARALRLNRHLRAVLAENPEARRATITPPFCSGEVCYAGRPSRANRTLGNTLFVNLSRQPFLWSDAELARMTEEITDWAPHFLDVDPVYGMLFARYCERHHVRLPTLKFILCSYEFLSAHHRRILQRVFGVPVYNLYGSTETGHLLMEDEQGDLIPSAETAFLEIIQADNDGIGELAVTTLTNEYMPLIRYRIGDLVERSCATGHPVYTVHGRVRESVMRPDGTRVTVRQVDACLAGTPGLAHYQLLERQRGSWTLRIAGEGSSLTPANRAWLQYRLRELLGATEDLVIQETDSLLAESSGKFRLVYPLNLTSDST